MKQGKQFFFLTSVNKESGYESEKIALAHQDQVTSWVTTIDYRGKDGSWNGLNNHVSQIHLNILFRLKEMLKNCVTVFPEQFRFSLNKFNVIMSRIIGVRKKNMDQGSIDTHFGPGPYGPLSYGPGPLTLCHAPGSWTVFFNNEKWTKTEIKKTTTTSNNALLVSDI